MTSPCVNVWVSQQINGAEQWLFWDIRVPSCTNQTPAVPTVSVNVPSCTTVPGSRVPVTFSITNNDTRVLASNINLGAIGTGQPVILGPNGETVRTIGLQPGQTGSFTIELERGFWGAYHYTYTGQGNEWIFQSEPVNVQQCSQDQVARVAPLSSAKCGVAEFLVANPADQWAEPATYSVALTDAAGTRAASDLRVADGTSAEYSRSAAAGPATLTVTSPSGVVTTSTTTVAACPAAVPTPTVTVTVAGNAPQLARTGR